MEEKLHIVISVKDFKSIITHAGITNTNVNARYSHPSSPMQITYNDEGLSSEFILMTTGESRGSSATPAPVGASKRPASRQPLQATSSSRRTVSSDMPPPPVATAASVSREAAKAKSSRPPPPPPQPSLPPSQALFHPEDEDRRWDPVNYDEEDEEMLLWDAPGDNVSDHHEIAFNC